jgi:hypothetical protein
MNTYFGRIARQACYKGLFAKDWPDARQMRMNWSLYVASSAALVFLNLGAYAQVSVGKRLSAHDTRYDTLRPESSFSDWRRLSLEGGSRPGEAGTGYGQLTSGDPLGANTPETTAGVWIPLSQSLSSLVETSLAPGALGGTDRSVLGQVARQFGAGWNMQAGVRHSELGVALPDSALGSGALGLSSLPPPTRGIGATGADLGMVTVERFWNNYRGAYTVASARAEGGATATSHKVQFDYFYDARSSVGLSYTIGRSFDTPLGINSMIPIDTNNVGVVGEHWFSRGWAINYNALIEDRGIEGLKPEIRLGLRLRF